MEKIIKISEILKAISNPIRLKIVIGLMENECNVTKMQNELNLPQPLVSHHLKILKNVGIIRERKDGTSRCYKVTNYKVEELINYLLKNFN